MGTSFETVSDSSTAVAVEVALCTSNFVWMRTADKLFYRAGLLPTEEIGVGWVLDTSVPDYPLSSITCGKDGQFAFIQNGQVLIKNRVTLDDAAGIERGTSTLTSDVLTFTRVSISE